MKTSIVNVGALLLLGVTFACSNQAAKKSNSSMTSGVGGSSAATGLNLEQGAALTPATEAANNLYVGDMVQAAGDAAVYSKPPACSPQPVPQSASQEDPSVDEDTQNPRLDQMANMMFDTVDTNHDGSISLQELQAWIASKHGSLRSGSAAPGGTSLADGSVSGAPDQINTVNTTVAQANLSSAFECFAPTGKMDIEGTMGFLQAQKNNVGRHRHKNYPGQQERRIHQQASDDVSTMYSGDPAVQQASLHSRMNGWTNNRGYGRHQPRKGAMEAGMQPEAMPAQTGQQPVAPVTSVVDPAAAAAQAQAAAAAQAQAAAAAQAQAAAAAQAQAAAPVIASPSDGSTGATGQ